MTWALKTSCSSKSGEKPRIKLLSSNLFPTSPARKPSCLLPSNISMWLHFRVCTEKLQESACLQQTDSCNFFSMHTNIQTQMPWVIKGINQDCLVELWFTKEERRLLCAVTPTYLWLFSCWKAAKELRHLKREIVQYAGNSTCNHVHFN